MITCDYTVELDDGEVLRCAMEDHPGAWIHSTDTTEFKKIGEGLFSVRRFADGLRPQRSGQEVW